MRIPVSGVLICCLFALGCKKVDDLQPQSDFEKSTDALPSINFGLDSTGSKVIQFDSIAQGGNFSISLTGFKHCKLKIQNQGKTILVEAHGKNWKKDSSDYTICKNNTCRTGSIHLINLQYITPRKDSTPIPGCINLPLLNKNADEYGSDFYYGNLFPVGVRGRIETLSTINFTAEKANDTTIRFRTTPLATSQKWGWDTITYTLSGTNGKCYKGKIAVIIGDICEASATDDNVMVTNGYKLILEDELTLNDKNCNGQTVFSTTRSGLNFETKYVQLTPSGFGRLEDTLIVAGNKRGYKYFRTNSLATKDKFPYYHKNSLTNRVTKAWVYLQLN